MEYPAQSVKGSRSMHPADPFRPLYHFTPEANWINDPNGLVYAAGEYHLFYQYHPYSTVWGPMHWGHAVSPDLVTWRELPIALYPDEHGAIFSGSAVIDRHNTAGFGDDAMVAVFTHHQEEGHRQSQSLAYSLDHGRTWTKYAGNPVLPAPADLRDFRDPKVFWYGNAARGHWVMCLAAGREIRFYTSPNLIDWTASGRFGAGYGGATGVWETPDLFELPVDGMDATAWVLTVGMGDGAPAGGSGTQYFVGRFDGATFTSILPAETVLWADYGADFYAVQSWSNTPDGRRVVIGWMNNWVYARQLPTDPWRGAMTVPRTMGLVATDAGPRLTQQPAVALADVLGQSTHCVQDVVVTAEVGFVDEVPAGQAWQLDIRLQAVAPASMDTEIRLHFGDEDMVTVRYAAAGETLVLDRRQAGVVDFHDAFPGRHAAPYAPADGALELQLLVDRASLELFTGDGRLSMTECIFPRGPLHTLEIVSNDAPVTITQMRIVALAPRA